MQAKERGNKHYVKKEFDLALAAYEEAISIDPSNMTFLTNKAAVFFEQGEYDRAITQCQEAIELGRSHRADYADVAKAFVRIGKAQLKKDDAEAALKSFRQAQVGREQHERTPLAVGRAMLWRGDPRRLTLRRPLWGLLMHAGGELLEGRGEADQADGAGEEEEGRARIHRPREGSLRSPCLPDMPVTSD